MKEAWNTLTTKYCTIFYNGANTVFRTNDDVLNKPVDKRKIKIKD